MAFKASYLQAVKQVDETKKLDQMRSTFYLLISTFIDEIFNED